MSSLADLPELVGFFSYSREDDEDSHGALSALRDRIQRELRGQLGRSMKTFRLWQDKEAIPSGTLWQTEIENAIAQSVFFIPIVTPTVVKSRHCRFELDAFLAREAMLGRSDLVFPILYIKVPALDDSTQRQSDPVLSIIAKRQWLDWREFRHRDVHSAEVMKSVEQFCAHICDALNRLSPQERKQQEEAAEAERKREEAEAKRREEEARQKAAEALARERAEEERRKREAEAEQRRQAEADAQRRVEEEAKQRAADEDQRGREAEAEHRRIAREEAERHAEGRIKIEARIIHGAPNGRFKPGAGKVEWFQDHEHAPEMVVVPAGEFMMGSPENEPEHFHSEGPLHRVKLARAFCVGRHAITRGQFSAFVNNTSYRMEGGAGVWTGSEWKDDPKGSWRNPGFRQNDNHPVVCVNWDDARAYAAWLSQVTGQTYRLLSEAEWEYAARAGTTTPFWWGSSIMPAQANYDGNFVYAGGGAKGEYRKATVPVGDFEANPWGLYNVHGNVWEWCEDIWRREDIWGDGDNDYYNGAPADGSAWLQGGDASRRALRGGSWQNPPQDLRSANRLWSSTDSRLGALGFRVGRTLTS